MLKKIKADKRDYDVMRILIKLCEHEHDFLNSFCDNDQLAVILGEYCAKYGLIRYKNAQFVVVMLVSYLTTYRFDLYDNFVGEIGRVYKMYGIRVVKDVLEVLILNVRNDVCKDQIQNGIEVILELTLVEDKKECDSSKKCGDEIYFNENKKLCNDVCKNVTENVIKCKTTEKLQNAQIFNLLFSYVDFFRINNFISKINNLLMIKSCETVKIFSEKYDKEEIKNILTNTDDENLCDILIEFNKPLFDIFKDEMYKRQELNKQKQYYKVALLCKYYGLSYNCIDERRIECKYLENSNEIDFSENYINGLSFIDKKCTFKDQSVVKFLELHEKTKNNNFDNIFEIIEFDCLFKYLIEAKNEDFNNKITDFVFKNNNLTKTILQYLSKIDTTYQKYANIEDIHIYKRKLIMLELEKLLQITGKSDFFMRYLWYKRQFVSRIEDENYKEYFTNNKRKNKLEDLLYEHSIKLNTDNLMINNIRSDVVKTRDISDSNDEEIQYCTKPVNNKRKILEQQKNKIICTETNKENICKNKLDHKTENIKIGDDIFLYLNENILINDLHGKLLIDASKIRVKAKLISILINTIIEQKNLVDFEVASMKNAIFILNTFKDVNFFKGIVTEIYDYYKHKNYKNCFPYIQELVKSATFDIHYCKDIIKMLINKGADELFNIYMQKIKIEQYIDFYNFLDNQKFKEKFISLIELQFTSNEDDKIKLALENVAINLLDDDNLIQEGYKIVTKHLINNTKAIQKAEEHILKDDNIVLYDALFYLSKCDYVFDNERLYLLLFKRSKLDNIGELVLKLVKIENKYLERLFSMFFIDPSKYINFLPRILNEGFSLTFEMIIELIKVLSKTFDQTTRLKIYDIIKSFEIDNKKEFCVIIIDNLEGNNFNSKKILLELLCNNYYNDFDIFVSLVKVLGNEVDTRIVISILKIMQKNKKDFYRIIDVWKEKKNLKKLMFRIYLLWFEIDAFYRNLMVEFEHCDEYEEITSFYKIK
ncbi:hypothetical protein COBT_002901 [Conglomerata obtusa]